MTDNVIGYWMVKSVPFDLIGYRLLSVTDAMPR